MAPHQRKKITVSVLVPFLAFVLFFTILIWQKYRSSHEIPVTPPSLNIEGKRTVTLFFATEGPRLAREAREIDPCENDNACMKSVLDELLNGPVGEFEEAIPEGTAVASVQSEGKLATIEFNSVFSDAMLSGTSAEMLAVYSVVNTIAANFPHIQQVKIDVAGNKAVILHHLDISEPLGPDYSLEQSASAASEKKPAGSKSRPKGTKQ